MYALKIKSLQLTNTTYVFWFARALNSVKKWNTFCVKNFVYKVMNSIFSIHNDTSKGKL